jgi:hypothetical protein
MAVLLMPALTRRRDPDRDSWLIHYGDVRVGAISRCAGNPGAVERWQWSCGFYPGSELAEHRHGISPTFEASRAAFDAAWREYLPKRSEADFQAWRDQQAWTREKYARFDRGERMPADWRAHG